MGESDLTCSNCKSIIAYDSVECTHCMAYRFHYRCNTVFYNPIEGEDVMKRKFMSWMTSLSCRDKASMYEAFLESSYYRMIYRELEEPLTLKRGSLVGA
jgi:hypothetical protein